MVHDGRRRASTPCSETLNAEFEDTECERRGSCIDKVQKTSAGFLLPLGGGQIVGLIVLHGDEDVGDEDDVGHDGRGSS